MFYEQIFDVLRGKLEFGLSFWDQNNFKSCQTLNIFSQGFLLFPFRIFEKCPKYDMMTNGKLLFNTILWLCFITETNNFKYYSQDYLK